MVMQLLRETVWDDKMRRRKRVRVFNGLRPCILEFENSIFMKPVFKYVGLGQKKIFSVPKVTKALIAFYECSPAIFSS